MNPEEARATVAQAMSRGWARKPMGELSRAQIERLKRNVREERKPRARAGPGPVEQATQTKL